MDRDTERSAVYAAELAAFDGTDLETIRSFEAISAIAEEVVEGEWWPGGTVEVRRSRSDAGSSSTRCGSGQAHTNVVRLAAPQLTVATVAHELAHALAGVGSGHDANFRRAFLDVVAVITNLDTADRRHDVHVDQLGNAFRSASLQIATRGWPAPPSSTTGPIAL